MRKQIFLSLEKLEEIEWKLDFLEDVAMSGLHYGYHWYVGHSRGHEFDIYVA